LAMSRRHGPGSGRSTANLRRSDRRGARPWRRGASAATLYSVIPWGSDHDAAMRIDGGAPSGGPILQERRKGHGWVRDTATSDRHRPPRIAAAGAPNRGCLA
jgi:hypothetical protein